MPKAIAGVDATGNPCDAALNAWGAALALTGVGRIGIAYSGGADSTALLLAAHVCWPDRIDALHVNHGMQASAASFEQHCRVFCAARSIPLHVAQLQLRPGPGESPEDVARVARYAALADLSRRHRLSHVALAHHADDQIETLLLALSRGAGLRGLSAMPARFERDAVVFYRPLLALKAGALRVWLEEAGVPFVTDPSNADESLTRNKIRHRLLPVLEQAFPAFRQTMARSAGHAAQAQMLLEQLAQTDALATGLPPAIMALQALSPERQANMLRYWLEHHHQAIPSAAQLAELMKQVSACKTRGHRIQIKIADGHVLRDGRMLRFCKQTAPV